MPMRKISRVQQEFINIIHTVAEVANVKDIEYDVGFEHTDIDCFSSGLRKVQLKGTKNRAKIKMDVIIKWHPNPEDRKCFREYYRREYVFYRHIVPELLNIQRNLKIEGLKMKFPNVILSSMDHDQETIVMQCIKGFQFVDRFHKMNVTHATLVIKNMAILHALSFALKKLRPNRFCEIIKLCSDDVVYGDLKNVSKALVSYFNSSVNVVIDSAAKEKLSNFIPKVLLALNKCTSSNNVYSTICHSDCWTNNIIFKYQGSRPVDVIFIDYQMARFASPVTDLSYFFYMCTDQQFLKKHYDGLLRIYYGTMTAVLRHCNLDVENIYPKSIFQHHLKIYSVFGLVEALISMKIITAVAEEAVEMTDLKYNYSEGLCEYVSHNQSLYEERVNGVVNDFFERGYSLDAVIENKHF